MRLCLTIIHFRWSECGITHFLRLNTICQNVIIDCAIVKKLAILIISLLFYKYYYFYCISITFRQSYMWYTLCTGWLMVSDVALGLYFCCLRVWWKHYKALRKIISHWSGRESWCRGIHSYWHFTILLLTFLHFSLLPAVLACLAHRHSHQLLPIILHGHSITAPAHRLQEKLFAGDLTTWIKH